MKLYFLFALLILSMPSPSSITLAMQSDTVSLDVITSDNVDRLQEIATLENLRTSGLSFSPDGTAIITGEYTGLKVWDIQTIVTQKGELAEPLWTFDGRFNDVAYSPDGKLIAAAGIESSNCDGCEGERGAVYLLSSQDHRQYALLKGDGGQGTTDIRQVAFSQDGKQLAAADYFTLSLWNTKTALARHFLEIYRNAVVIRTDLNESGYHSHPMMSLDFSPTQSNLLAFATADIIGDTEGWYLFGNHRIVLWDIDRNAAIKTLDGYSSWISDIEFSPEGDLLASASGEITGYDKNDHPLYSDDNILRLWNVQTGEPIDEFQHRVSVVSIAFTPDQSLIASLDHEGIIHLWNITTGTELWTTKGIPDFYSGSITFSPDGKLLVTSVIAGDSDTGIHFWGVQTN